MNYSHRVLPLVGLIVPILAMTYLFGSQFSAAHNSIVGAAITDCGTNLIVNGSFEQGTLINPNVLPTGSTLITGWIVSQGNIDYEQEYFIASDGVRSIDLNGRVPGAIQQTIATTPGQQYVVIFDLSGNYDGGPPVKTARVQAAGQFQDFTTTSNIKFGQWGQHTFTFTATNSSTALEFLSLTTEFSGWDIHPQSFGPTLDNVRVCQVTTTPSPKPHVSITGVIMSDNHTLRVNVIGEFSQNVATEKSVSVRVTLDNTSLPSTLPLPTSATGLQVQSLFIDLMSNNIPRFTENKVLQVIAEANEAGLNSDPATESETILLPVVVVPGIGNDDGNDNTFGALESEFQSAGYRLRSDFSSPRAGYPTLYTLRYDTNGASFHEGAEALARLIEEIRGLTWAAKVNIVGHSKGGLVARKFVQNEHLWFEDETVKELVAAQSPHLGSILSEQPVIRRFFSNLLPIWPWIRNAGQPFFMPRYEDIARIENQNTELARLNGMAPIFPDGRDANDLPFPPTVPLTLVFSDNHPTGYTFKRERGLLWVRDDCAGDGVVPAFSQLGRMVDPNDPRTDPNDPNTAILIPAFRSSNFQSINIRSHHDLNNLRVYLADHFSNQ